MVWPISSLATTTTPTPNDVDHNIDVAARLKARNGKGAYWEALLLQRFDCYDLAAGIALVHVEHRVKPNLGQFPKRVGITTAFCANRWNDICGVAHAESS